MDTTLHRTLTKVAIEIESLDFELFPSCSWRSHYNKVWDILIKLYTMSIEELIVPDEEVFSTADADVMEQLSHLFERKDSHLDYVASDKTSFTESDSADSTMQDPRFIWYANIHTSREFPDTRDILNWTEFDIFQYAVRSSPGSLFPELFGSIFDIRCRTAQH